MCIVCLTSFAINRKEEKKQYKKILFLINGKELFKVNAYNKWLQKNAKNDHKNFRSIFHN